MLLKLETHLKLFGSLSGLGEVGFWLCTHMGPRHVWLPGSFGSLGLSQAAG